MLDEMILEAINDTKYATECSDGNCQDCKLKRAIMKSEILKTIFINIVNIAEPEYLYEDLFTMGFILGKEYSEIEQLERIK